MRRLGSPQGVPSLNKRASGCGRLRRPPTQPAGSVLSLGADMLPGRKQSLETK